MENQDTIFSDITPKEIEAGILQKFFTPVFDIAVDMLIIYLLYLVLPRDAFMYLIGISRAMIPAIIVTVSIVQKLFFLLLFNKTVGMILCRVKLLNKDLQPLSPKEKFISLFRSRFSSIKYYKDI